MAKKTKQNPKGAGRPKIYDEKLVNVTFTCPVSKVQELKKVVRNYLKTLKNEIH